jgi:flagellar biosynthetic protein FliS
MNARALQSYRRVATESAPPPRVLDALYGRLLADCAAARKAIEKRDPGEKGRQIAHALAIIDMLDSSLDPSASREIVDRLRGLYGFVRDRLLAASASLDIRPLLEAEKIAIVLRDAFAAAQEVK